jgi:predicted O-linked N-acetylglucosamine transferase (SPINDLY family)
MGVPVLTVAGKSMVSRQAAAVLSAVGCNEWISNSTEELVSKAKNLIGDKNNLSLTRRGLRHKISNSELMNHKGLADELGKSFRSWWLRWLEKEGWLNDKEVSKADAWPVRLPPRPIAKSCPYPR